jgi:hypothetical protein
MTHDYESRLCANVPQTPVGIIWVGRVFTVWLELSAAEKRARKTVLLDPATHVLPFPL